VTGRVQARLGRFAAAEFTRLHENLLRPEGRIGHGYRSHSIRSIMVEGMAYKHNVIIRLSGEVVTRKKKLSKRYYGTSHVISKDEAKFVFEQGCEQLIIGAGQMGNVKLSPEAEAYFAKMRCKVRLQPTPEAIGAFNRSRARAARLFHMTC